MSWEDIPSTTSGFLKLHKTAIKAQPSNSGPMVVHCRCILQYLANCKIKVYRAK